MTKLVKPPKPPVEETFGEIDLDEFVKVAKRVNRLNRLKDCYGYIFQVPGYVPCGTLVYVPGITASLIEEK